MKKKLLAEIKRRIIREEKYLETNETAIAIKGNTARIQELRSLFEWITKNIKSEKVSVDFAEYILQHNTVYKDGNAWVDDSENGRKERKTTKELYGEFRKKTQTQ